MKLNKIDYRIIIIFSLLLCSLAFTSFIIQTPQIEDKEILNPPLNLSDTNPQYINSISVIYGSVGTGSLSYTQANDANYMQYNADYYEAPFFAYGCELSLNFNPPLIGDDYKLSVHIETSPSGPDVSIYVNGQVLESSNNIDFNVRTIEDVTSIKVMASDMLIDFNVKIYYFKLELIQSSTGPWYESFENHDIGYFNDPNWQENYGSNYIEIVSASTFGVDMEDKILRMFPQSLYDYVEIEQSYGDNLIMNGGDSLYLKFRIQVNKDGGKGGRADIILKGDNNDVFFFLMIGTSDEYENIAVTVDMETNIIGDTTPNQVYDFDILFVKKPGTNKIAYNVFINQVLEFYSEYDIGDLYPKSAIIKYEMFDDGPGNFFLDNYFLGYVDNDVGTEKRVSSFCPIYYLYVPKFSSGTNHVEGMSTNIRYYEIHDQTVTVKMSFGVKIPFVFSVFTSRFVDMTHLHGGPEIWEYEVATKDEDLFVYYNFTSDITDISFILPGVDPETGVSEIYGVYDCELVDTTLRSASISSFQQMGYEIPQDYYDCQRSGNAQIYGYRTITAECSGGQTKFYRIETKTIDLSKSFNIGMAVPIFEIFSIGASFTVSYVDIYEAEVKLGVDWDNTTSASTKIQYDLYAPPEGTYSTNTDLPPFSVDQVAFHEPVQVMGLSATGGQQLVSLTWAANTESDLHHYNIYRNDVRVATTTYTSYTDTGLVDSTTYRYRVAAVNIYGEEGPKSSEVQATTDEKVTPGFTESILLTTLAIGIIFVLYRFHLRMKKPN